MSSLASLAINIANKPAATSSAMCDGCGLMHPYPNRKCKACGECFEFCIKQEGCNFQGVSPRQQPVVAQNNDITTPSNPTATRASELDLKAAFQCWLVSSELITAHPDPEKAFAEFETYVRESLTPVEQNKRYLRIVLNKSTFELLDSSKLYRNQDGVYVVVDGNRRNRIGKDVAVLG